jgi:hypothetical protein
VKKLGRAVEKLMHSTDRRFDATRLLDCSRALLEFESLGHLWVPALGETASE